MILAATLAVAVSLAGIAYLTATDPKRRRTFHRPRVEGRRARAGWAAVVLPGLLVPVWGGGAGFVIWLGTVSVVGWVVAAVSPERSAGLRRTLLERAAALRGRLPRFPAERGAQAMARLGAALARPGRADLEARIAELEAEVARLGRQLAARDADGSGVVVEMLRPATGSR